MPHACRQLALRSGLNSASLSTVRTVPHTFARRVGARRKGPDRQTDAHSKQASKQPTRASVVVARPTSLDWDHTSCEQTDSSQRLRLKWWREDTFDQRLRSVNSLPSVGRRRPNPVKFVFHRPRDCLVLPRPNACRPIGQLSLVNRHPVSRPRSASSRRL